MLIYAIYETNIQYANYIMMSCDVINSTLLYNVT